MWNIGGTTDATSSASADAVVAIVVTACAWKFWWVSMAPLGFPVVPEVYMIAATVSSGTSTAGRSESPPCATRPS